MRSRLRVLAGRVVLALFLGFTAWMLLRYAREVRWADVLATLAQYRLVTLLTACVLAGISYAFYCSYDLAARHYTGHTLSTRRVALITFVTYAISLNLGAVIGGAGFRFNLYSRAGLRTSTISRIIGFSVSTNWLGYAVLLGALLAPGAIALPSSWPVASSQLRLPGLALLLLAPAYVLACARWHDRQWTLGSHVIVLPRVRLALLQLLLSCCNWLVIAAIPYVLLLGHAPYSQVLLALLLSGIAAAAIHVPAGLGVMEAVFVALLAPQLGEVRVLAALIAYRAVYYLLPLGGAALAYFGLHLGDRRRRPRPEPG